MKRIFVEPNGLFAVKIPNDWLYKNEIFKERETSPHSFEHYHNTPGCFQISCNPITKGKIPEIISSNNLVPQSKGKENLIFAENHVLSDSFDMLSWIAVIDDLFVWVKYIYDSKKRKNENIKREIIKTKEVIKTIFVIPDAEQEHWILRNRYDRYMISMMASLDLRNRAYENGSFIELVILIANYIDALLRLGVILDHQLANNSYHYDIGIIYQSETDKPIMEKKIYKIALDKNIITQNQYDKLFKLYNERNKVVHRYIISDIKTLEIMSLVKQYEKIENEIGDLISNLEFKQFENKVGFNKDTNPRDIQINKTAKEYLYSSVREKHHHNKFSKDSRIL